MPIGNFDVTGEFVYSNYDTREAIDGLQLSPFTERTGALKGWGYYAQVGYWAIGDHEILGHPSYGRPIHVDLRQAAAAAAARAPARGARRPAGPRLPGILARRDG